MTKRCRVKRQYDTICECCGGLIARPNQIYGCGGSFCYCPTEIYLEPIEEETFEVYMPHGDERFFNEKEGKKPNHCYYCKFVLNNCTCDCHKETAKERKCKHGFVYDDNDEASDGCGIMRYGIKETAKEEDCSCVNESRVCGSSCSCNCHKETATEERNELGRAFQEEYKKHTIKDLYGNIIHQPHEHRGDDHDWQFAGFVPVDWDADDLEEEQKATYVCHCGKYKEVNLTKE